MLRSAAHVSISGCSARSVTNATRGRPEILTCAALSRMKTKKNARNQKPARRNRRQGNPQGADAACRHRRGPRDHGAERLRKIDAGERARRPSEVRSDLGHGDVRGQGPARAAGRGAGPRRRVSGHAVSGRDSRASTTSTSSKPRSTRCANIRGRRSSMRWSSCSSRAKR